MPLSSSRCCAEYSLYSIRILPLSAEAETFTGKVVGITDGDTIAVLVAERSIKVRLAEIDTPERGQPWALRAKQALSDKACRRIGTNPAVSD